MIIITNDTKKAKFFTSGGRFNLSEIFSTVILEQIYDEITLCRGNLPEKLKSTDIVYGYCLRAADDSPLKRFDAYSTNGANKCRDKNGIPYSSVGLIWEELGKDFMSSLPAWEYVDEYILEKIDGHSTGYFSALDYPELQILLKTCTSEEDDSDDAFLRAVESAKNFMKQVIENAYSQTN